MKQFYYKGNDLYCEQVPVSDIAQKVGTPFYLYSHDALTSHYMQLAKAYKAINPLICYSTKANSNLAVLKSLVKKGAGLDIVSGGELFRALKVGANPKKIVFAGVGKTRSEIKEAIQKGILLFNVESVGEVELINDVAKSIKKKANVSLRVNPDVDASTHDYITTGKKESKFGIDLDSARKVFAHVTDYKHVNLSGIHVHIGSQITTVAPFVKAFKKVMRFIDFLEKKGTKIKFLNLGGGLGIVYDKEKPQTPKEFARKIVPIVKRKGLKIIFEPGRFIAGNAGIFVTEVIYSKKTPAKNFLIVDGAMNDLIRPSLYDAYHEVRAVKRNGALKQVTADIVGPICESGDFFAKARKLPDFQIKDQMAVMSAGAYGFTMASNYNSRPRVAEVMVSGKKFEVIRKRETREDLIRGERIPKFI